MHMVAFAVLRLLSLALFDAARGDLTYHAFSHDPDGRLSHLRLEGGSSVDFYSTEFTELCNLSADAGPIHNPPGITQRFQHPQRRNDPYYNQLPEWTYLDDGQLDNPYAGRVAYTNYTEVVITKAFVADANLQPLPHNRTQLCHYALRLTPPDKAQNAAVWSHFKQLVAYGWETEFHFRILHRTMECVAAGLASPWCERAGADGFAFVIQNFERRAVGTEVNGLGYGFPYSLAVEFDTFLNNEPTIQDKTANHISVHIAREVGEANTANHVEAEIASATDIPLLQEGTHLVRIAYSTKRKAWDSLGRDYESDLSRAMLSRHSAGRPGLLTVEFDGQRVIAVAVDLAHAVQVDGTGTAKEDPPLPPNETAYDELGSLPGKAWVGFTSSTSFFQYQSVDILSWTFREERSCPTVEDGILPFIRREEPPVYGDIMPWDMVCRINQGTEGRRTCLAPLLHGPVPRFGSPYCSMIIQNLARTPIRISARLRYDNDWEATLCEHGNLEWDALHPYFLGCAKTMHYTGDLVQLWINSYDGIRAITVQEEHILQIDPMPFKRRSLFRWCVKEHSFDLFRLSFAECSCEYCIRLLDLSASYAVFYQDKCFIRYGLSCPCFESSEVTHDQTRWTVLEPLIYMQMHVCRGCAYNSQCAAMLKVATCEIPPIQYRLGNPLTPNILSNGFEGLTRDRGRVLEGLVRGDACNCEPNLRPYSGSVEGRSGMCSDDYLLVSTNHGTLDYCTMDCENYPGCQYLTYWDGTGECALYNSCPWQLCRDTRCFLSVTFELAPLGLYIDTRGMVQEFNVFPNRTLQTNFDDCYRCLHLYEEQFCYAACGPAYPVPYTHWPAGQLCATCMFAGNRMHELTPSQTAAVKNCVYEATRNGEDPWIVCDNQTIDVTGVTALDLFNGVSTHFLSECPGRTFTEAGAVCVPNIHARDYFPLQVLSRMAAAVERVWDQELECLNAVCHLVPRYTCYERLGTFLFEDNFDEKDGDVEGYAYNGARLVPYDVAPPSGMQAAIEFTRDPNPVAPYGGDYVVTSPLPWALENTTIEAWVTLDNSERITNVALNQPSVADIEWKVDYMPNFATDGDLGTYWSSQLTPLGMMDNFATFIIDLEIETWAGQINIFWLRPAADFSVSVSSDNVTWTLLTTIVGNNDDTTYLDTYFKGRWVNVTMTRAARVRPDNPPGNMQPQISIREIEVIIDDNLSRLKPTLVTNVWDRPVSLAIDGDLDTFWATPPNTESADLYVDLGSSTDVKITRIFWRYTPRDVKIYYGTQPCADAEPTFLLADLIGPQVTPEIFINSGWVGQCLLFRCVTLREVYGQTMVAVKDVEVFQEAGDLAPGATLVEAEPAETNPDLASAQPGHLTPVAGAFDGDPTTWWLVQPMIGGQAARLTLDLGAVYTVMSVEVRWATIQGEPYRASGYFINVGLTEDSMEQVEEVKGYSAAQHKVVIFMDIQFVQLDVTEVMWSNPDGKLAVEDLVVYQTSDNLANRSASRANATSEWANCPKCEHVTAGSIRTHGTAAALDGDLDTWWGLPFDPPANGEPGYDQWYFEVHLAEPTRIELIALKWIYPSQRIIAYCSETGESRFDQVITISANYAYVTTVPFIGGRVCGAVRLLLIEPVEHFAGLQITGIKEVEIYDLTLNYALRQPTIVSDGSDGRLAVDSSDVTKWTSVGDVYTNLTVDLGTNVSAWGARILFPSNQIAEDFSVWTSFDGVTYELVDEFRGNSNGDVYIATTIQCRYAMVVFEEKAGAGSFALRTFAILGGPNWALNQVAYAPNTWLYNGFESVDGVFDTFWVSEPLASHAQVQVDLSQDYFIGGGVTIDWMYPPEEFAVYISRDGNVWDELHYSLGNYSQRTTIWGPFEARYFEVRLLRPYIASDDGIYGIRSIDVLFDPNLAHWKYVNVTHDANESLFLESMAHDNNLQTFWMPYQGTDVSMIIFDMEYERGIGGVDIRWRRAPVSYRLERQEDQGLATDTWHLIRGWAGDPLEPVQQYPYGFIARKIKIQIEEAFDSQEGKIVALRELIVWVPNEGTNIAAYRPTNYSHFEVLGNPPSAAVDTAIGAVSQYRATYYKPFVTTNTPGMRQSWLIVIFDTPPGTAADYDGLPPFWMVSRVQIYWRWLPLNFQIEFFYDTSWTLCADETAPTDTLYTLNLVQRAWYLRITQEGDSTNLGIYHIIVQTAEQIVPPVVEPRDYPWIAPEGHMIDHDLQSYWMSETHTDAVVIWVDLWRVYVAEDIQIYMGFRDQGMDLFSSVDGLGIPRDGIHQWIEQELTSTPTAGLKRRRNHGVAFSVRYIQVHIVKGFQDEEYMFGTSVRDIAVILFRNMAKWKSAVSDSIWNYPPSWAVDGITETMWVSRHGVTQTQMVIDLGQPTNIAGLQWWFGSFENLQGARRFHLLHSLDGVSYHLEIIRTSNEDFHIVIPDTVHFKCRYVKLELYEPMNLMTHPDNYGDLTTLGPVFAVSDFEVYEHTGGGAAFGLQNLDGTQYTSVAYGLRQPGQWIIASEQDIFTRDFDGGGNVEASDLGTEVQLVITLKSVGKTNNGQTTNTEVILYRNGVQYGSAYTVPLPSDRLTAANQTRLVFGVRSTAHDNQSTAPGDPTDGVLPHGRTHSPFFQGKVSRAALFQGALSPEEVRGVYERVALGGPELGCHCFDACPTGSNRFFPDVPVPCSGQGACLRAWSADTATGYCMCQPGFSGPACQNHCSDLSVYGCCEVDDDCPENVPCNQDTKACAE